MRLINTETLELKEFISDQAPPYAILSHTWEPEGEITLEAFQKKNECRNLKAFSKIQETCRLAKEVGLGYAWIDTCCINKDSSAELSEAIHSMFRWYAQAAICYVYFSDLEVGAAIRFKFFSSRKMDRLRTCRWFSRGWTLQELIAPAKMIFYDQEWNDIGDKNSDYFLFGLSQITGIDTKILQDYRNMYSAPLCRRMSWASRRQTTRVEDQAYCLLGIFDVNMPMLYGEGNKAFLRLQEEIVRSSTDLTLFAWKAPRRREENDSNGECYRHNIFAMSPADFANAGQLLPTNDHRNNEEFALTNKGLRLRCALRMVGQNRVDNHTRVLPLYCRLPQDEEDDGAEDDGAEDDGAGEDSYMIGIFVGGNGPNIYARVKPDQLAIYDWEGEDIPDTYSEIYITTKQDQNFVASGRRSYIQFGLGFAGRISALAPMERWNFFHRESGKLWYDNDDLLHLKHGLFEMRSMEWSEPIYVYFELYLELYLAQEGLRSRLAPSVKLANKFMFDSFGIDSRPHPSLAPNIRANQTLYRVIVYSIRSPQQPLALLSVSETLNKTTGIWVVDLETNLGVTNPARDLPSLDSYKAQLHLENGTASEIEGLGGAEEALEYQRRIWRRRERLRGIEEEEE